MVTFVRKNISTFLILIGVILIWYSLLPYFYDEVHYRFLQWRHQKYVMSNDTSMPKNNTGSVFGNIMSNRSIELSPVNREFSLVIEKIGLSVPVVLGVSVTDETKYKDALKNGVAHAITSDLPSDSAGNVYLFAHSSFNFWSLGKYATAFNLIDKLQIGDEINVFYHDKRYIYSVVNREVYPGWNTYPLTRPVIEPLLTLQTCTPPGTTLNRMVITSKLKQIL